MRVLGRSLALIISLLFVLCSTVDAQWRLDGTDSDQLRNFRRDEALRASASAQPSLAALRSLHSILPRGTIYVIDLRQESHGFADGVPISWYEQYNQANADKTLNEINRDEVSRLLPIADQKTTFEPLGRHDIQTLAPLTLRARSVETESYAASQLDLNYVRFPSPDMSAPDELIVDEFVRFVEQLPPDAWLHFHCHAGHGRTTTFLVMLDLIRNPTRTLEESVARQVSLGGSDLLAPSDGDDWYAQRHRERADFLRDFARRLKMKKPPALDMPLALLDQTNAEITILGEARATQAQMVGLINRRNSAPKLSCSVEELVRFYYEESEREGIRADLALCQAIKETGAFSYGGDVDWTQNNYCGLGATGNRVRGASFESPRLGARAHVQHLLAYATTRRPSVDVIDPRYEIVQEVRRTKINHWLGLGGTWAVPGTYYGEDILNTLRQALAIESSESDAFERGLAEFNRGSLKSAIECFNRVLELAPTFEGYYDRALAYERLNDRSKAIADYTRVLGLEPMLPSAWFNRGRLYWLDGQSDLANADFARLLEIEPHFRALVERLQ